MNAEVSRAQARSSALRARGGRRGIGGHQLGYRGRTDTWLTPPDLLARLGAFDCDPCAALNQPWRTASVQYTEREDGMTQPWAGRVWLNPA